MSLQLANHSVKYPIGILENILVQVGQFFIPIDFIIMDIKEDSNIPIILGRPFLETAGAIIDVKQGKMTFEVGEEKIEFILSQFLKAFAMGDTCYFMDIIDECIEKIKMEPSEDTEILEIPAPPILEDEQWKKPSIDDNLRECLALTLNPMPCSKKPSIELKSLPKNIRYEFLDIELEQLVIINSDLGQIETEKRLHVLMKYPNALGYNISNLRGTSPSLCMHRIMLEEDSRTSREHQR